MEWRLAQKREQFRVSIRRKHKNKALGERRNCLLELVEQEEQLMSEDSFIGLCHELIRGYLLGDVDFVERIVRNISTDRLLMLAPRVIV